MKLEAHTYNGAIVKLKENAKLTEPDISFQEELKVLFPLYTRIASALHFRLTNKDTRIHYDHGIDDYSGHFFNLYGSFGFSRDWKKHNYKIGAQLLEKNLTVDTRLKLDQNHVSIFVIQ